MRRRPSRGLAPVAMPSHASARAAIACPPARPQHMSKIAYGSWCFVYLTIICFQHPPNMIIIAYVGDTSHTRPRPRLDGGAPAEKADRHWPIADRSVCSAMSATGESRLEMRSRPLVNRRDLTRYQHRCLSPKPPSGSHGEGEALDQKICDDAPNKKQCGAYYPHRVREPRIGRRYTSHTCARPLFVPLSDTHMGEWRTRTQTR
jgi:hypothetical protein